MRVVSLIVVAVLAAAVFVVPRPPQPVPRAPDPAAPAPYTVCPLAESARRSTVLSFLGGGEGTVAANVFSGGEIAASTDVTLSPSGTGVLELSEVTGLARAPLLIGLDDPARVVETVLSGSGVAASTCGPGSADAQVVLGGATTEDEVYTLVVANPFAVSATVDVHAASEVGPESDQALEGIVVPPRSVVPVDLSNLLPGRQSMSAAVVANQGRVMAGALHQSGEDMSAMAGIGAGNDAYLPLPDIEGATRSLVLLAPDTAEVPFQLDLYGPDGVVEAAYEDVVPARGQVVIPVADLMEGPGMVRVVSAGPVSAALAVSADTSRAVVPGTSSSGPAWFLPGAGRLGESRVLVFNPGEVDVAAELLSGTGDPIETFDVPASTMVEVQLGARDVGARLEGDGELVVHWVTTGADGMAADVARLSAG